MSMDEVKVWYEKRDEKRTGRTIAVLWDGEERFVGISECSKNDHFQKKRGRLIAIKRAERFYKVIKLGAKRREGEEKHGFRHCFGFEREEEKKYFEQGDVVIPGWMIHPRRETQVN